MKRLIICASASILSFVGTIMAIQKNVFGHAHGDWPHGNGMMEEGWTLLILGLCVIAVVEGVIILIRGTITHRIIAVLACMWPCFFLLDALGELLSRF